MSTGADADLDALTLASDRLGDSLASLTAADRVEHWRLPTPCAEWDVRGLVDHVVGGNWFTSCILDGQTADDAMAETMGRFAGGSATIEQARSSVIEQHAAFQRPGVLESIWHHVAGDLTGRQIIRLRLHDLIAHTWDLDAALGRAALGREASIPDRLVRWGLDELAGADSLTIAFFAPVDGGRSDETDAGYLRLLGRDATGWDPA